MMENMSPPSQTAEYIYKIPPPCLHGCDNLARVDEICKICEAKNAYADYAEDVKNSQWKWVTGPEILRAGNVKLSTNGKHKKRANIKVILIELDYLSQREFILDMYYCNMWTYDQICEHVIENTSSGCSTSLLMRIMRDENLEARSTNYYREESRRFKK